MTEGTAWGRIDDELAGSLLEQRTLVMGGVLDEALGNRLCSGLMVLSARDPRADIHLWVSSPGGSVPAMLAIRDVMTLVPNDVSTLAMGIAASAGQFLLSAGAHGKRYAMPHARVLLHQGSAGIGGTAMDIAIQADDLRHTRDTVLSVVAAASKQSDVTGGSAPTRHSTTASSTTSSAPRTRCRRPPYARSGWGSRDEQLSDPLRDHADQPRRAHRRRLQPAARRPDHLPGDADRRRGRQRGDRAADPPGVGGPGGADQPVPELTGRLDPRHVGDLRRDAVRAAGRRDHLRRSGGRDRGRPARGGCIRTPADPAARTGGAARACGRGPRGDPGPDPRGRRDRARPVAAGGTA